MYVLDLVTAMLMKIVEDNSPVSQNAQEMQILNQCKAAMSK